MSHRVLIVDDEAGIRQALKQVLEYEDLEVRVASSGGEAISLYSEFKPQLVFLDVKMARMDGLEALTRIRENDPAAVVIMISGHGTIDTAVEATRRGAFDFLEKPLDTDRLLVVLRNALQTQGLVQENARLRGEIESRHQIVGRSFALRQVLDRVEKVAPTEAMAGSPHLTRISQAKPGAAWSPPSGVSSTMWPKRLSGRGLAAFTSSALRLTLLVSIT